MATRCRNYKTFLPPREIKELRKVKLIVFFLILSTSIIIVDGTMAAYRYPYLMLVTVCLEAGLTQI